ncbi:MAG TPA: choice-of-anchor D domain-containing protein, partial [Acidimicrobiales bacterium]|nr:choice-of-anchor D domain-containing protein [Acidimicrobiales bacterium]
MLVCVVLASLVGSGVGPRSAGASPKPAAAGDQFLISPTSLDFGSEPIGTTAPSQNVVVTNVSGSSASISVSGGGAVAPFSESQTCGPTLAAGASCQLTYDFDPNATGSVSTTATGSVNGQAFTVTLAGAGTDQFQVTPTGLDFGSEPIGTTSPGQVVTVTNVSASSEVLSLGGEGVYGAFSKTENCDGTTLTAGASCQLTYFFDPTMLGSASAVDVGSINGQSFSISLTGTGTSSDTGQFVISPTSLDFGSEPIGTQSPPQVVNITNVSGSSAIISAAGGGVGAPFSGYQNCESVTLAPGKSCQFTYFFDPTATGPASGSTFGAVNGQNFSLTFTGVGLLATGLGITSVDATVIRAGVPVFFRVTTSSPSPPVIKARGLPRGLTLTNDADGTATIAGIPALKDAGFTVPTITARIKGQPVVSQSLIFTIYNAGHFSSKDDFTDRAAGGAFSIPITVAAAYPTPAITAQGLPAGVSLTDEGNGTALLSDPGPIDDGGTYSFTITADSSSGNSGLAPISQSFTLTLYQLPVVSSIAGTTITAGSPMLPIPVTAVGFPAPKVTAAGLPVGVKLMTGPEGVEIAGTP